jgi:DNA-binding NtrC family response regulator
VRKVVARVLEHFGYRALVARDLGGAMHVSERHDGTIHAALVQMESPEEPCPHDSDGFLRSHPEMKLLCMSGYPRELVCRVAPCRASGFIRMPFAIGDLASAVREALHGPLPGGS